MYRRITCLCLYTCLLSACIQPAKIAVKDDCLLNRYEFSHPQMGTMFQIVLYAKDSLLASSAAQAAFARIDTLNNILTDYSADSELSRLSATAGSGRIVPVSKDLWTLLKKSIAFSQQTGGALDVTVGPYVQLWRRARRQQEFPSSEALAKAKEAVGYQHIKLYPGKQAVQLLKPGMKLDVGSIGKGYAADAAIQILQQYGIHAALVNGGGKIMTGEAPPGKKGWQVEIIKHNTSASPLQWIWLERSAISTSGDMFQYVELDGKRYSHILNPRTGVGLTEQIMVTVLAKDGLTADYLSTAVSVLGPIEGMKLIEGTKGATALITRNTAGNIERWESRNFKALMLEQTDK